MADESEWAATTFPQFHQRADIDAKDAKPFSSSFAGRSLTDTRSLKMQVPADKNISTKVEKPPCLRSAISDRVRKMGPALRAVVNNCQ